MPCQEQADGATLKGLLQCSKDSKGHVSFVYTSYLLALLRITYTEQEHRLEAKKLKDTVHPKLVLPTKIDSRHDERMIDPKNQLASNCDEI